MRKGSRHSLESRRRMSEAMRGEKHRLYGKHHSEETRKKISEANKIAWRRRKQRDAAN